MVNCTLNSEKDLNSVTLPDDSLSNIELSDHRMLRNIKNIADQNAGVYVLYIPSTATSELVEVILYTVQCGGSCPEVLHNRGRRRRDH